MSFEKFSTNEFDVTTAMRAIEIIESRVMQLGANDYEHGAFQSIKDRLTNGILPPKEAVEEADKIKKAKMDYH